MLVKNGNLGCRFFWVGATPSSRKQCNNPMKKMQQSRKSNATITRTQSNNCAIAISQSARGRASYIIGWIPPVGATPPSRRKCQFKEVLTLHSARVVPPTILTSVSVFSFVGATPHRENSSQKKCWLIRNAAIGMGLASCMASSRASYMQRRNVPTITRLPFFICNFNPIRVCYTCIA